MSIGEPYYAVISTGRSQNVPKMQAMTEHPLHWYVKSEDDATLYKDAGAMNVIVSGGLCDSRNNAMEDAFSENRPCLQLGDDLSRIHRAMDKKTKNPIDLDDAVKLMTEARNQYGGYLLGGAPTDNAFFFNPNKPVRSQHFILGDGCLIYPNDLRFDTGLKLKEDYDYTLQHITNFGMVTRVDYLLYTFKHYSNPGGAVDYRSVETETEAITYLKQKWGLLIKDHPRRENEILLNL